MNAFTQTIGDFTNFGTIAALNSVNLPYPTFYNSGAAIHGVHNNGTIENFTNLGSIYSESYFSYGVRNTGTIGVLNNAQGVGNVHGALTYYGVLPTFYNISIASPTSYGQLSATSATGAMTFGVFGGLASGQGASRLTAGTYSAVLSGVTEANLVNQSGVYRTFTWRLALEAGQTDIWDLIVSGSAGPSISSTLASMTQPRQAQTSLMRQRSAALSALLDADCASFGQYGLCVSAQARATVGLSRGEGDGGGRASLAVRLHPNLRVGGAVELAPISGQPEGAVRADRNPSLGLFAVYQAPDGQGLMARVAGAMRSGNMTIDRLSDADGEPGFGRASLRSRALAGEMGWGFAIGRAALLTPYLGLRYVSVTRGAYAEGFSATTQYPIFYDAFSERALSGHFGARLQAQIFDKVSANLTFGGAYDLARGSQSQFVLIRRPSGG